MANTYHDESGLANRVSTPHVVSASGGSFLERDWAATQAHETTTQFDELGRATVGTQPNGKTTTTTYDGWNTEVGGAKSHKKRSEQDAFGRTVAVKEYTGTDTNTWAVDATTTYGYNLSDQLTSVTEADNNLTSLTYDSLGRKTSMQDRDMGSWSYGYDALSNLVHQTDALGQVVEFGFDKLNRPERTWHAPFWAEPSPAGPSVYDLQELRSAVDTNLRAAGLSASTWTDPAIVTGTGVKVRAGHFTELCTAIGLLWVATGDPNLSTIPAFSGGTIDGSGTRSIKSTDLMDLRTWLAQYESSTWAATRRARVFQQYDEVNVSAGQFGTGKRTALWDGSGRSTFRHDKAGRTVREERVIDGTSYVTQQSFDAADRPYQATFPDGEVLTHSHGAHGRLTSLSSQIGQTSTTLVSGVQHTALGQVKQYDLGGNSTSGRVNVTYNGLDGITLDTAQPFSALRQIDPLEQQARRCVRAIWSAVSSGLARHLPPGVRYASR